MPGVISRGITGNGVMIVRNKASYGQYLKEFFGINVNPHQFVIALAGNPNVGKSTVFNALTGLRQHTGNWAGKTVCNMQGNFVYKHKSFLLVDLPGTYSLLAHTLEEEIARDFICFGRPDITLVVLDATCLERNLNLALQILEITGRVVLCVNLLDEAEKKKIYIDIPELETELGVPVVGTAARKGEGLENLLEALYRMVMGASSTEPRQIIYSQEVEEAIQQLMPEIQFLVGDQLNPRWVALRLLDSDRSFIERISFYLSYRQSYFPSTPEVAIW